MDWMEEVQEKIRRRNQVLFTQKSALLSGLGLLAQAQNRRTMVLWALELAGEGVAQLEEKNPGEGRPRAALEAAWAWAEGRCKMPQAQRAILDCHAAARDAATAEAAALCHAVGQACSVVHTPGHALGYPMYELTAIVRRLGAEHCRQAVENRARDYEGRLLAWAARGDQGRQWAPFLRG